MKTNNILLIALFMIASVVGCKKSDLYSTSAEVQSRITATTDSSVDSKVAIDGVTVTWAESDTITVVEIASDGTFSNAVEFTIDATTISDDGKSAEFVSNQALSESSSYMAFHGSGLLISDCYELSYSYGGSTLDGTEVEGDDIDVDSYYQKGWMMQSDSFTANSLLDSEVAFSHISSMLELTISSAATVYLSEISVSASGNYFAQSLSVEADGSSSPVVSCSEISVALDGTKINYNETTIKIPVTWSSDVTTAEGDFTFTIKTTSGDEYRITKTAQVLESGARYRATLAYDISIDDLIASDRAALIALYNATDGDNWYDNTNWCSDAPLSEWYGVTVDDEGRVMYLWLYSNNVIGEIPVELAQLTELISLYLTNNSLSGEIPAELGSLPNLIYLILGSNDLSGEIPSELGNIPNLYTLNVSYNQLTGDIPQSIKDHINFNNFVFSPQQDGYGLNIEYSAEDRETLIAIYNAMGGDDWSDNTNWCSDAPIDEWYGVKIDGLGYVSTLSLSYNNVSGEIPTELANLSNLYYLSFWGNSLTGSIPSELANLSNLNTLDLSCNDLTGEIPSEFGNLSSLEWIFLEENNLSGEIPSELGNLSGLIYLCLYDNNLSGEIPSELGNLSQLTGLYLENNQLTGVIPQSLQDHDNYSSFVFNPQQDGYGVIE